MRSRKMAGGGFIAGTGAQSPRGWARVTPAAAFSPRDTAEGGVIFKKKMWLSNGFYHGSALHRDLWSSSDGATWVRVLVNTPYVGYSEMVVFKGRLWAIKGSVWNSMDGVRWKCVLDKTPFGGRGYGEALVHGGKLWQLGSGPDVWSSPDGINWTCVCKAAPYGARYAAEVVSHSGRLWLMGGSTPEVNNPPEKGYAKSTTHNDVWSSADGAEWKREVAHAPWAPRQWFAAAVYGGEIWLVGGFDNVNKRNLADVWHSRDGIEWRELVSETQFSPRHEPAIFVFDGSLWVVAGNSWPLDNDVWRLECGGKPSRSAASRARGQAAREECAWSRDASRWGAMRKGFHEARAKMGFLAAPESAANVGMLLSDLTGSVIYRKDPYENWNDENRWTQNHAALWAALGQSQIPADAVWAETLSPALLGRYRALTLMGARIVTDDQAAMLRKWVNAGGVLIAGGAASLHYQGGGLRPNYLLSDLFGVNYDGNRDVSDPNKVDTYCIVRRGSMPKAVPGSNLDIVRLMVFRAVKPVASLGIYKVSDAAAAFLPGITPGTSCEYDMPLGYDKVKPGAARVLAAFANGDPALTVNKSGRGLCYFWTPVYPALCHVARDWETELKIYRFWPNVRELLAAMVKDGLAHQKAALPAEVTGVPEYVEVIVRRQPEQRRWMIHLRDHGSTPGGVKGAALAAHPPAGESVKRVFYPDTDADAAFKACEGGVTAKLRDFEEHDMVAVEW